MKKMLLLTVLFVNSAFASSSCFLVKENGAVLQQEGDCKTAYTPESTFKIPLSLIGFDSGILRDPSAPSWSLPVGVDPYINVCKVDYNPHSWIRDSCLWYSRILTTKLGMEKFQGYVDKFSYGNQDLSGDKGQNNGLTHSWILSSSLRISPEEQTHFLQKLVTRTLPVSDLSYNHTKQIMFIQEMSGGWKLYGKTGNGVLRDKDDNKTKIQHGWFVGYIEKDSRKVVFASHIVDSFPESIFASFRARNQALSKLWYVIDILEK